MHGPRLDPPERDFPSGVEDTLGSIIMWPEGIDEDTMIPEFGEITDYEEDEPDAEYDDEGIARTYGGGIRYEVTNLHPKRNCKETMWITESEVEDFIVPPELEPIIEQRRVAIRAQQKAQGEYNRYDNMRRQVGYNAVQELRNRMYQERQAAKATVCNRCNGTGEQTVGDDGEYDPNGRLIESCDLCFGGTVPTTRQTGPVWRLAITT